MIRRGSEHMWRTYRGRHLIGPRFPKLLELELKLELELEVEFLCRM